MHLPSVWNALSKFVIPIQVTQVMLVWLSIDCTIKLFLIFFAHFSKYKGADYFLSIYLNANTIRNAIRVVYVAVYTYNSILKIKSACWC